jgi:hypothetical protein
MLKWVARWLVTYVNQQALEWIVIALLIASRAILFLQSR